MGSTLLRIAPERVGGDTILERVAIAFSAEFLKRR